MKRATLERLLAAAAAGEAVVLATDLASGEQRVLARDVSEDAHEALRRDQAFTVETEGRRWFLQPWNPPLRLVIVGAVHIAQALAKMAALSAWAVTIVDPREAFATAERFPGVTLDRAWPDAALRRLAPDARTAIVTLTHDPKLDEPALAVALRSPAFYVGALGSKKTHAARLERLRALGLADAELARIHAPVGLPLGARSPAEIAVSILAELTQRLREPRA